MLSNFGTGAQSLLQFVLVGQPEFRRYVMGDNFEQLRQRMIASYHLRALDAGDTTRYIEHRLSRVGWQGDPRFTAEAYQKIFAHSGGIPRKVNLLCDRMLLFGYLEEKHELAAEHVDEVLIDLDQEMSGGGAAPAANVSGEPTSVSAASSAPPDGSDGQRHGAEWMSTYGLSGGDGLCDREVEETGKLSEISKILQRLEALEKRLKRARD